MNIPHDTRSDAETSAADTNLHLAYAEASIMLIESLMLLLVERRVLSVEDLSAAVEIAVETKKGFIAANLHPQIAIVAAGVLREIGNSVAASESPRAQGCNGALRRS